MAQAVDSRTTTVTIAIHSSNHSLTAEPVRDRPSKDNLQPPLEVKIHMQLMVVTRRTSRFGTRSWLPKDKGKQEVLPVRQVAHLSHRQDLRKCARIDSTTTSKCFRHLDCSIAHLSHPGACYRSFVVFLVQSLRALDQAG